METNSEVDRHNLWKAKAGCTHASPCQFKKVDPRHQRFQRRILWMGIRRPQEFWWRQCVAKVTTHLTEMKLFDVAEIKKRKDVPLDYGQRKERSLHVGRALPSFVFEKAATAPTAPTPAHSLHHFHLAAADDQKNGEEDE